MCVDVLPSYMLYMYHVSCLMHAVGRRWCLLLWNLFYRWLWTSIVHMGVRYLILIIQKSSQYSCWAISPASSFTFFYFKFLFICFPRQGFSVVMAILELALKTTLTSNSDPPASVSWGLGLKTLHHHALLISHIYKTLCWDELQTWIFCC